MAYSTMLITVASIAQAEFDSTVANAGINQYFPTLSSVYISGETTVYFGSNVVMIWMLPGISSVTLTANSAAEVCEMQGSP